MFDLYLYDEDTGEMTQIVRDVDPDMYKCMAHDYWAYDNVVVKVIDQYDGSVVYTVG